jgi:3-hydroxybutyryl-CoA dehydrogenase
MRTAVLGAGVMGAGIAQVLATAGHRTACYDLRDEQLEVAARLSQEGRYGFGRAVERGKLTAAAASSAAERLEFTSSLSAALDGVDIVIEAVPEDLGLKMQVFADVDAAAPPHTILASNTSGLPITALAAVTARPELVIGWHWASPAQVMRMAEVVTTPMTSAETIETVRSLAVDCGKNPVLVRDEPKAWGFAANRVVNAMVREARRVVAEGIVTADGLDQLLVDGWGWPVGPMEMVKGATEGWGDGRDSSIRTTRAP